MLDGMRDVRVSVAAVLALAMAAGCGGTARQGARARVLDCLHASGWVTTSERRAHVAILRPADGHTAVKLVFWPSEADARRAVPDLAPIGEGWMGTVSWRSGFGFTLADEQVLDRCLASAA